jgi:D-alanyl-D-alanine carboxypeptidase (penicillin-binding protein 5/6)
VNPHGLDAEGQVSSAYDLALIARAGMSDPQFAAYAATRRSSVAAPGGQRIEIATKNRLLKDYDGALGIKNGYTNAARASFVGAAERDGQRLVVT